MGFEGSLLTSSGFQVMRQKFDCRSGGRDQWLLKVHNVELSKITPAKIQEWKQSFLGAARDSSLGLGKARISVNTLSGDRAASSRERYSVNCHHR